MNSIRIFFALSVIFAAAVFLFTTFGRIDRHDEIFDFGDNPEEDRVVLRYDKNLVEEFFKHTERIKKTGNFLGYRSGSDIDSIYVDIFSERNGRTWRTRIMKSIPAPRKCIYLLIDDCGGSPEEERLFLNNGLPLGFAIIPGLQNSFQFPREVLDSGRSPLLHLPMEPEGDENPGGFALLTEDSDSRLLEKFEWSETNIGPVRGFNNHMGSRATRDERVSRFLVREAAKRGYIIIDSMTHPSSLLFRLAREEGVFTARRDVFLDNEKDFDYIAEMMRKTYRIAENNGRALAIGHIYDKVTLEAILAVSAEWESPHSPQIVGLSEYLEQVLAWPDRTEAVSFSHE